MFAVCQGEKSGAPRYGGNSKNPSYGGWLEFTVGIQLLKALFFAKVMIAAFDDD